MGSITTVYLSEEVKKKIKQYGLQYSEVMKLGLRFYETIGDIEDLLRVRGDLYKKLSEIDEKLKKIEDLIKAMKKLYDIQFRVFKEISEKVEKL